MIRNLHEWQERNDNPPVDWHESLRTPLLALICVGVFALVALELWT